MVWSRRCPAKLNLSLHVRGVRADGFHELESLVMRVGLCDTLTVHAHEDGCYALTCDDASLPRDGSNLVLRAARAVARAAGVNCGAEFGLRKRIPAGAGLGGGSSNAAGALRLVNEAWGTGLAESTLVELATELGSDVPLFLAGPVCILRGRGEQIEEVRARAAAWVVLVLPKVYCATPAVYAAWDRSGPRAARPPASELVALLDRPAELMEHLYNDLQQPAFDVAPELRTLAEAIARRTGRRVALTGSGSGLFRLFEDEAAARAFAQQVGELEVRTEVVRAGDPV